MRIWVVPYYVGQRVFGLCRRLDTSCRNRFAARLGTTTMSGCQTPRDSQTELLDSRVETEGGGSGE